MVFIFLNKFHFGAKGNKNEFSYFTSYTTSPLPGVSSCCERPGGHMLLSPFHCRTTAHTEMTLSALLSPSAPTPSQCRILQCVCPWEINCSQSDFLLYVSPWCSREGGILLLLTCWETIIIMICYSMLFVSSC